MLKKIRADLHIHSCLSPCGDISMTPETIVRTAKGKGLDAICICDHNSSENSVVARKIGESVGITVFLGMEINSKEEVHILGIFEDPEALSKVQEVIYEHLRGENDDELFGYQMVINENDEIADLNSRLLIGATDLSVENIVRLVHENGGIAIASHIDRERFSLLGQLGFVPEGLELDGLELSPAYVQAKKNLDYPALSDIPQVTFSDAHMPEDIGKTSTVFLVEEISLKEIKMALENKDGRSVLAYS